MKQKCRNVLKAHKASNNKRKLNQQCALYSLLR